MMGDVGDTKADRLLCKSGYNQKREIPPAVPGAIPKWNDDAEIAVREMVSFLGAAAVFAIVQNWILETTSGQADQ